MDVLLLLCTSAQRFLEVKGPDSGTGGAVGQALGGVGFVTGLGETSALPSARSCSCQAQLSCRCSPEPGSASLPPAHSVRVAGRPGTVHGRCVMLTG